MKKQIGMIVRKQMSGYNFWSLICKLKNYYYGHNVVSDKIQKEVSGRIEWFNNYLNIVQNSNYFQKQPLPDLVKGNIVLVELGFNIGMEFGGRHYCIVLKNSLKNNKRVLVLPITTQKPSDYEKFKNTLYIEFNRIKGLNAAKDIGNPNGHKRWVNILNIRSISKNRIIYPVERGIPNITKGQMREISERIISQIAIRGDLIKLDKKYKKLEKQYNQLLIDYKILQDSKK